MKTSTLTELADITWQINEDYQQLLEAREDGPAGDLLEAIDALVVTLLTVKEVLRHGY